MCTTVHAFRIEHYLLRVENDFSAEATQTGEHAKIKINSFTVG